MGSTSTQSENDQVGANVQPTTVKSYTEILACNGRSEPYMITSRLCIWELTEQQEILCSRCLSRKRTRTTRLGRRELQWMGGITKKELIPRISLGNIKDQLWICLPLMSSFNLAGLTSNPSDTIPTKADGVVDPHKPSADTVQILHDFCQFWSAKYVSSITFQSPLVSTL